MSTVLPAVSANHSSPVARQRIAVPAWLREPLLHFVVLGAVLFGVDQFIVGRSDDPRVIVIDARVDEQARRIFSEARGHAPSEDELYGLRRVWLDNEVLYREGVAQQLDKGDPAIRDRLVFKALSVIDAGLERPRFDEAVLRDWFERNRAKYDEPARYDFQEAVLTGDSSEGAMRTFVQSLNAGTPGDASAGLRVFKGRPRANLVQSYGTGFVEALEEPSAGEWRALPSREGWRAIRLQSTTPPRPADFDKLRGVVMHDWTDAILAEQRTQAVRALARKYTVKVVGTSR